MKRSHCLALMTSAVLSLAAAPERAAAQFANDTLRIGVLTDESGPYADSAGPGSILAAKMAVADFGGSVKGHKIEIVDADTQNKPDVAAAVARRWFDTEGVSAVVDLPVTPVAFAVQDIAKQKNRTVMVTASAASEFTSKACSAVSTHWADDTHALAAGTARALSADGGKTWFFLTVDIAFGAALQREATAVIEASGGKVLGVGQASRRRQRFFFAAAAGAILRRRYRRPRQRRRRPRQHSQDGGRIRARPRRQADASPVSSSISTTSTRSASTPPRGSTSPRDSTGTRTTRRAPSPNASSPSER